METELAEAESVAGWVRSCQGGRSSDFEPLVRHFGPRAYRFALYLTGDAEEAKDLSQEAFIRAFAAIGRFDATRPFYPWFLRILRNLCYSHLRRRRSSDLVLEALPEPAAPPSLSPELKLAVWEALGALGEADREMLVLKTFQGLSYAEIAEVLDIPRGTVMSRLYHARRRLKAVLDGNDHEL